MKSESGSRKVVWYAKIFYGPLVLLIVFCIIAYNNDKRERTDAMFVYVQGKVSDIQSAKVGCVAKVFTSAPTKCAATVVDRENVEHTFTAYCVPKTRERFGCRTEE